MRGDLRICKGGEICLHKKGGKKVVFILRRASIVQHLRIIHMIDEGDAIKANVLGLFPTMRLQPFSSSVYIYIRRLYIQVTPANDFEINHQNGV